MDLLLKLKIKHSSGIKDYIEQIKKDPEYYMGEVGYTKLDDGDIITSSEVLEYLKLVLRHFFKNPRKNYNPDIYKLIDFPEYIIYDKEIMDSYKGKWREFFKNYNPIYLEFSAVDNSPHADMIAIPLKNNMYYIIGYAHSRLDDGDIITSSEVLEYLKLVRKEYDYSEYDYCDDEVYYYNDYYYDVL